MMGKTVKKTVKKEKAKKASAKATPTLFTIGYEQATVPAVMRELTRAKVDLVVDTRAVAASRRPGFSKKALAAALDEQGIAYLHLQKLGTPPEGREAARAGDHARLWRIYAKHLKTKDAQGALDELLALIEPTRRVALLCYCRDPRGCHRDRVVDAVKDRMRVSVEDLVPTLL
jgi:uncharacterized protein (DUF488 family)